MPPKLVTEMKDFPKTSKNDRGEFSPIYLNTFTTIGKTQDNNRKSNSMAQV